MMTQFSKTLGLTLCATAALSLSACTNVRESLGLQKDSPDEFAVLTRAPLEMPPELALPPPQPGMPRPQEQSPVKKAQETLLGAEKVAGEGSQSEDALLSAAGAENAQASIRETVNQETAELNDRNQPIGKRLLSLGTSGEEPNSATLVDPKKELERLQKNKEEGKSITEGETPYVEE